MIKICSNKNRAVGAALVATLVSLSVIQRTRGDDTSQQVRPIVAQIQHADYAGDRAAMQKGYDDLKPFLEDKELASRIRYWRGFAQWRRAINGFNDSVDPKELEQKSQHRDRGIQDHYGKGSDIRRCQGRHNFVSGFSRLHEPQRPGVRESIGWPDFAAGEGS